VVDACDGKGHGQCEAAKNSQRSVARTQGSLLTSLDVKLGESGAQEWSASAPEIAMRSYVTGVTPVPVSGLHSSPPMQPPVCKTGGSELRIARA
jgi:hypothetical protein